MVLHGVLYYVARAGEGGRPGNEAKAVPQSWLIVLRCACGGRPGNEAKAVPQS